LAAIFKMADISKILKKQNFSSNGDLSLCQILCLYQCHELIPDIENFYWSPFSKWPPQYYTNSTLSDFNDISYVGRL
jgi:hypothetical protein